MTYVTLAMHTAEELYEMEHLVKGLEELREALPWLIFIMKVGLMKAKRAAGVEGPILPPGDAPPVEAVAA